MAFQRCSTSAGSAGIVNILYTDYITSSATKTITCNKGDLILIGYGNTAPAVTNLTAVTQAYQMYSIAYQILYQATATTVTIKNDDTFYSLVYTVVTRGGEPISYDVVNTVNGNNTISDVNENEIFITHDYNTNVAVSSSDNKTSVIYSKQSTVGSFTNAAMRAKVTDSSAIINMNSYCRKLFRMY